MGRFYQENPLPAPPPPQLQEVRRTQPSRRTTPPEEVHQIPVVTQDSYPYFPEEIFLSSVLPTRTPRELRAYQQHCWDIYQHQEGLDVVYDQGINRIRDITTSPLHFQNLLWRSKTTLTLGGIIECYCWIRRRIRNGNTDRVYLEPAYQVSYPWSEFQWIVSRLQQHPRI